MFVGWAILSPLAKHKGWAPGPTGDMETGPRGWILWVALAIMTIDSTVSILPVAGEFLSIIRRKIQHRTDPNTARSRLLSSQDGRRQEGGSYDEVEPASRLVPTSWVVTGLIVSVVGGTIIVWVVFGYEGIKPWATLLGFVLGGAMSLLGYVILTILSLLPPGLFRPFLPFSSL